MREKTNILISQLEAEDPRGAEPKRSFSNVETIDARHALIAKAKERQLDDSANMILPPIKKRGLASQTVQREALEYLEMDAKAGEIELGEVSRENTKMENVVDSREEAPAQDN